MSALTEMDPKEVRTLVHRKLDAASDEEVAAVHRVLLELEAKRLFDSLGADFEEDWATGRLTKENIQEAILEHRRKHPYR